MTTERDLFLFEREVWNQYPHVAGLDEAGRGAWAGPVVAAAIVFEPGQWLEGVDDSKKLSAPRREKLFEKIKSSCLSYGIGVVEVDVIDSINILQATKQAMIQAISQLKPPADFLLVDGNAPLETPIPQRTIIEGDTLSFSIAAASILAKVTRDRLMINLSEKYPGYSFEKHKGYGTAVHQEALRRQGICLEHRRSYAPIAAMIPSNEKRQSHLQ